MSDKEMIDVIATGEGFDGVALHVEGDRFQMPKEAVEKGATWFKRADEEGGAKKPSGPTAADVIKSIPDLSDDDLAKLEVAEDDREGGARVSVIKAINAEQKRRADAKDEAAKRGGSGESLA